MISLDAPIIPGESAAGICIGQPISELLSQQSPVAIEELACITRYEFGPVWVWANDNIIDQIGVFQGYAGALSERIKVRDKMLEVKNIIGEIFEDMEDNLCVLDSPGWCFETSHWDNGDDPDKNLGASIVGIFVFAKPNK